VTDFASLQLKIDSTEVAKGVAELDRLTAAGGKAEQSATKMTAAEFRAAGGVAGLTAAMKQADGAAGKLALSTTGAGAAATKMAADAQLAAGAMRNVTVSAGAQRAGMQQLSYQVGDVAQQFALGVDPMRIFVQQGGQVVQAIGLMGGGARGLIGFMGGPWGIGIATAAAALIPLLGNLSDTSNALDDVRANARSAIDALNDLAKAAPSAQIAVAQGEMTRLVEEQADLQEKLRAAQDEQRRLQGPNYQQNRPTRRVRGAADELAAANLQILNVQNAINQGNRALREQAERERESATSTGGRADATVRATGAARASTAAISDEQRALEQRTLQTDRFIAALNDEIDKIGLSAGELRQLEIAQAKGNATSAEQIRLLDVANQKREEGLSTQARQEAIDRDRKATEEHERYIRTLEAENTLIGLVGPARELAALALEKEAFLAQAAADGILDGEAAWQQYNAARLAGIDKASSIERDAIAAGALAENIGIIMGEIGGRGGIGDVIGGLLGLTSGQIGGIGGPLGAILNLAQIDPLTGEGRTGTDKNGKPIALTLGDALKDALEDVFGGPDSTYFKTFSSLLQGTGTGLIAGNAFGLDGSALGQLGSGIGGALGQAAGDALSKSLGGLLGSAAGPLGSVVGGVLGGLLGGLASSTPRGSATIGNVGGALGVSGTAGNSSARVAASSKSANAVIESLSSLAEQLGATLDPSRGSVSIGIRDGNFRVDTSGQGKTKTKKGAIDFGEDAEAAALFAMLDLIKDGVLVGLRKGTELLLKNAKDLETGVVKALKFEGVFKELAAIKDPLGAALADLTKEFDGLRKIFAEAGASAEEYAQLEELLALKRKEAVDDEARRAVDKLSNRNSLEVQLLELLGRKEDALAASRLNELASTEAVLQPLQRMIYELEDARGIMAQFEPLAADLKAFKQELLGGQSERGGYAVAAAAFRDTATLAKGGDADALGQLRGTATEFLDAARANASSALDYQRAVGEVLGAVDSGIFAADTQIEYAQLQIDAVNNSANIIRSMKDEIATYQQAILENTVSLRRMWERFEGDGLTIKTDADTPLQVEVV